jgi:hypothetical protein
MFLVNKAYIVVWLKNPGPENEREGHMLHPFVPGPYKEMLNYLPEQKMLSAVLRQQRGMPGQLPQ